MKTVIVHFVLNDVNDDMMGRINQCLCLEMLNVY